MGKKSNITKTLDNGEEIIIESTKSQEDGHTYYHAEGVAFDEPDKVVNYINERNSK